MSRLIASIFVDDAATLPALLARAWAAGADAVELRLDGFQGDDGAVAALIDREPERRWILTCRGRAQGGRSGAPAVERFARLIGMAGQRRVHLDVEQDDLQVLRREAPAFAALEAISANERPGLILSHHQFDGFDESWASRMARFMRDAGSAWSKFAYTATDITQSFAALDLMREARGRAVAIAMGEDGFWTRVLARKLGAWGTYAALDEDSSTAPGQGTLAALSGVFRWSRIGPVTRVYGVLGDPVGHSLGPVLFNHWFERHGVDAVYLPLRVRGDESVLRGFLDGCRSRPWLDVGGLSVTVPWKGAALRWAGEAVDSLSAAIGAVNTLSFGSGGTVAFNSDCFAALASLAAAYRGTARELVGLPVDVLGTGGAARSVVHGLGEYGARVTVYGRNATGAAALAELCGGVAGEWAARGRRTGRVVINCTSLGMESNREESPLPADGFEGCDMVFDLIYRPVRTRLLLDAEAAGCTVVNGLDMYLRQAATQFELWTGCLPDLNEARGLVDGVLAVGDSA